MVLATGMLSACQPMTSSNSALEAASVHALGAMQHNYVVYPGDQTGNSLDNMQRDALMQKYWPQLEGHHTFRVEKPSDGWDGEYDYFDGHKPSYEEDFAAPASPIGPALASGIAITVENQADWDKVLANLAQVFKGAAGNIATVDTTIDVQDSGLPLDKRFTEFKRRMLQGWPNNGLDGTPAFPGNFFPWVTVEKTVDGTGTETTEQVVDPHIQSDKLPAYVSEVAYALNTKDRQDFGGVLQAAGFIKRSDGADEVWIGGARTASVRIIPNEDPNVQGLVTRTYVLYDDVLDRVHRDFGRGAIHRDFGFGVSLDIPEDGAKATLRFQSVK
jgi:hypothetical protein